NISAPRARNSRFQLEIICGCTSNRLASSLSVSASLIASIATWALKAALCFFLLVDIMSKFNRFLLNLPCGLNYWEYYKQFEPDHNPDILDFDEDLELLNYTGEYIVRVLFAGIFTGFYDDNEDRIFTGDVVKARVLLNPTLPSDGGRNRARNHNNEEKGSYYEAGVSEILGNYSMIFDNHSVPLSWATELEITGTLF